MRHVLVTLGVLFLILGPYNEYLHDHAIGQNESDCVACQTSRTPVEAPDLTIPAAPTLSVAAAVPDVLLSRAVTTDLLQVAPKNSPPGPV